MSTNLDIFPTSSEALGGGNPTLENPLNQIADSLINPDYVSPKAFSANTLQEALNEIKIPEAVLPEIEGEPEVVEGNQPEIGKKRGGIKFLKRSGILVSCLVGLTLQGSSCQEQLFGKPQESTVSKSSVLTCYDHTASVDNIKTLQEYLAGKYPEYKEYLISKTSEGSSIYNGILGPKTTKSAITDGIIIMEGKKPCPAQNPNN